MQKKIIALAIASAMTVPALAYADATVYGQARLSIDMINNGAQATGTSSASYNQLNNRASRVGFKGSEDLGGGLSAVWQMETDVVLDTGSTTFFTRNTYLGLKSGDMGTVVLGRNDTPYKTSTRKLDVFIDTVADNRSGTGAGTTGNSGLMSVHDTRWNNSITYTSPAMNGMSIAAATVFGAEDAPTVATANKKGSALSLAGMYEQGPIYATLAYQTVKAGDAGTGDLAAAAGNYYGLTGADGEAKAFKLGGSYAMDAITVNLVIERPTVKATTTAGETSSTNLYLAGKFGISSTDAVKLAYTKRGDLTTTGAATNPDDSATQIAIGYDHAMSKNTTVYALYMKETDNTGTGVSAAADPSVLSFGMNHSF